MANVFRSYNNPTEREKHAALIKTRIREIMLEVAADEIYVSDVVAGGIDLWRQRITAAFAPFPMGDVPEMMYRFFCQKVIQLVREADTSATVEASVENAKKLAGQFLDNVEPVTPPTEKEIAESWELDDASSYEAKKELYGDMHPKEYLRRLVTDKDEVKH